MININYFLSLLFISGKNIQKINKSSEIEMRISNNLNYFLNSNIQIDDIDLTNNFSSETPITTSLTENILNIQNIFPNTNENTNPDDSKDDDAFLYRKTEVKIDVKKKDECTKRRKSYRIKMDVKKKEKVSTVKGRKKKNSNEKGNHTKYTFDNILKKIKTLGMNSYLKFLNKRIEEIYQKKDRFWKLEKIKQYQYNSSNIKFNREFFYKTLKEILSEEISDKCKRKKKNQNKILIERLLNEEKIEKRIIFERILNIKFIDVLNYLNGKRKDLDELKGLEYDDTIWKNIKDNQEYYPIFCANMNNIEIILKNKISRNRNNKNCK